ncbi:Nuclear fragile X mental retardation-interacting protein 1 [Raphanus sativus]|nr:Nuclear fragile X mental retardation-interacting protein 1 [Raphanus sativus]
MSTTAMVPILKGMIFEISLQKLQGNGQGFQRSQLHQADNPKKKFGLNKDHTGNGNNKRMSTELDDAGNIAKQWRGARRKNYPTKSNAEKNASDCNLDEEAKMRCQQHREVLAKQA